MDQSDTAMHRMVWQEVRLQTDHAALACAFRGGECGAVVLRCGTIMKATEIDWRGCRWLLDSVFGPLDMGEPLPWIRSSCRTFGLKVTDLWTNSNCSRS